MLKALSNHVAFPLVGERQEKLMWILTLLFPAVLPLKHGVSTVFFLMVLLSIYVLIQSRPRLNNMAKYMLAGFIVLILVSMLSMINADDVENGIRRIKKLTVFILLIPIFTAMVSVNLNLIKPFLIGACIGGFVLLGIAIYQVNLLGHARIEGFYNAIMFGSISVITALALIFNLLLIKGKKIQFFVISLSLFGAMFAAIQSESRGPWLGLIVGLPLGLSLCWINKEVTGKKIVLVSIASILLISVNSIFGKDDFTKRWDVTIENIERFQELGDRNSSFGERLTMWEASVKIWYRHPIIGTGIGDFHVDYVKMIKSGEVGFPGMKTIPYSYAHSTIFEALACIGIVGFVGMILATFILPIAFFLKAHKNSKNEWDRYATVFGLVFVTAFMIFGFTENWLAHKQLVVTYSLLLAITASRFGSEPR